MRPVSLLRIVLVLFVCGPPAFGGSFGLFSEAERMEEGEFLTIVDMMSSTLVLLAAGERGVEVPRSDSLVRIKDLAGDLPSGIAERLVRQDAWGGAILVRTKPTLLMVSTGKDGSLDLDYEAAGRDLKRVYLRQGHDDICVSPDGAGLLSPSQVRVTPDKTSMADLRRIGIACEAFAVDHDRYPGPTRGLVPVETLVSDLEAIYIKRLPLEDGWGETYWYWSDGEDYIIISAGSDRTLDRAYTFPEDAAESVACGGPNQDSALDIIWSDGAFCQWFEKP